MSTYTIKPTSLLARDSVIQGTSNSGSTWATATDAQIATYTNDGSDTTGIRSSGSGTRNFQFALASPSIASDEFICRIRGYMRWTSAVAGKTIGDSAYKISDGIPAGVSSLITTVQTSPGTSELGYDSTSWANYPATDLALNVTLAGDATAANRPVLWEVGAYVYTLQRATAVPQNYTSSLTTYPYIPVDVTATIDWEASTNANQKLRTVSVEMRIESGGSSVGTGTLIASGTKDVVFDSTGTITTNVLAPTPVPNGSYKVYTRAIRHRENEISVAADQIGVWSTAATLTMSVTPPNAPTLAVTADNTNARAQIVVTPVASAPYTSPYASVERSDDGGVTWNAVRSLTAVSGSFGVPILRYDYEAPYGISVKYRARISAITDSILNTSVPSTTQTVTLTNSTWNIKCPQAPNLNMIGVTVVGQPNEDIAEDLGIFRPLNRRYPVTVSGSLTGWDGDLQIFTLSDTEWTRFKALAEAQLVLYIESPFGWSKYIRLSNGIQTSMAGTPTAPRRRISAKYVQTSAPTGGYITVTNQFGETVEFGFANTTTWDETWDLGNASLVTFDEIVDGGQAV